MANTYTQLYIHFVFAVKGRQSLIRESFRDELEKYMCGIIRERNHKPIAIYCMPDHTHILVGLNPAESISTLMQHVKSKSSGWIDKRQVGTGEFNWQSGYGAFSYGRSQLNVIVNYIQNQPHHHRTKTFKEEYLTFLALFDIDFKQEYLFDWIDED